MATVLADEVSPALAGNLYCTVIEGCQEVHDAHRVREWTVALTRWCEAQPGLVPYRGQCQVHRAEIMMLRGAWDEADAAAVDARTALSAPPAHPATGAAEYLCAELHRLRGRHTEAEQAYRRAARWGREPQPGLARLRLAQGEVDVAAAGLRRALEEVTNPIVRPELLAAAVDVLLAAADVPAAAARAAELSDLAARLDGPVLHALATACNGAVRAAEGDTAAGLAQLRTALALWHDLDAPYETARMRVEIGRACRELGDEEGARMEFDAAAEVFARLHAAPDLARARQLAGVDRGAAGLTARELEVLRLVARGLSNRAIAAELVLSDKTVARHVSNIFTKVGVHSRAAAAAWAHDHRVVHA
jgi:DNA-binding CsgD family transcriptional regulator